MVHLTNISKDQLWKVVAKIRRETSFDKSCDVRGDGLYELTVDKRSQIAAVELFMKLQITEYRYENITYETLLTAAEMFIYLNICPGKFNSNNPTEARQKWFQAWYRLYNDLFSTHSQDQILLTLNRLMKSESRDKNDLQRNQKLFEKTATLLKLKYENIHRLLPGLNSSIISDDKVKINPMDFARILHPVHIINKENSSSQSAFIPFCEIGGNMSAMGVKIDQFSFPVCNSFKETVLNDQLCYEVDLNRFVNMNTIDRDLELGFTFIMDYNEDRQVTFDRNISNRKNIGLTTSIVESDHHQHAFIYLNTIGNLTHHITIII